MIPGDFKDEKQPSSHTYVMRSLLLKKADDKGHNHEKGIVKRGMKTLSEGDCLDSSVNDYYSSYIRHHHDFVMGCIEDDYHLALIRACLKVLGAPVIDLETVGDKVSSFTRDYAVVLENKNIILLPADLEEREQCMHVMESIAKNSNYKLMEIKGAHFGGGNCIYLPHLNLLLNGVGLSGGDSENYKGPDGDKKISLTKTYERLQSELKSLGIEVMGIKFNPEIVGGNFKEFYYHLDCFMQFLSNGKLIILNKKMLSEDCRKFLEDKLQDKFIDLEYEGYLEKPILLNWVEIRAGEANYCLVPNLPDEIIKKLNLLGLTVITPSALDPESPRYDRKFCEKVVEELNKIGFKYANLRSLLSPSFFKEIFSYRTLSMDENIVSPWEELNVKEDNKIPASIKKIFNFNFVFREGGPGCLTFKLNLPKKAVDDLIAQTKRGSFVIR